MKKILKSLLRIVLILIWGAVFLYGVIKIQKMLLVILFTVGMLTIAAIFLAIEEAKEMPDDYDDTNIEV